MSKYQVSKEDLEAIIKICFSLKDIAEKLNWKFNGCTKAILSKKIIEYEIDTSHFLSKTTIQRTSIKYELMHEKIAEAVNTSLSVSEVMRKVGIQTHGNHHGNVTKYIRDKNIDISHFKPGIKINKSKKVSLVEKLRQYSPVDILPRCGSLLKDLVKDGYKKYECEYCGIVDWRGKQITLQLHHVDGDRFNFQFNNLLILCPNCHSQTDNWGNKKRN